MRITIENDLTGTEALASRLQTALGETFVSIGTGTVGLAVYLTDDSTPEQVATAQALLESHVALRTGSFLQAANIPNWAKWTEAQALTWIDAHTSQTQVDAITNLATAKVVIADMCTQLRALTRLTIALRNKTWPGLQE